MITISVDLFIFLFCIHLFIRFELDCGFVLVTLRVCVFVSFWCVFV